MMTLIMTKMTLRKTQYKLWTFAGNNGNRAIGYCIYRAFGLVCLRRMKDESIILHCHFIKFFANEGMFCNLTDSF